MISTGLILLALAAINGVHAAPLADGQILPGYPKQDLVPDVHYGWSNLFLADKNITDTHSSTPSPNDAFKGITNCGTHSGYWAMTFNDGPGPYSQRIFDSLRTRGVPATFFSVGSRIIQYNGSTSNILGNDYEMAMLSWSHPHLTTLTNDQIVAEVVWNAKAAYDVTGKVPRYFRPPYGEMDNRVNNILTAMGVVVVSWNRDSEDWELIINRTTVQQFGSNVDGWISGSNPNGVISLQHEMSDIASANAHIVIDKVAASNFKAVRMSECIDTQDTQGPYLTSGKLFDLVTGNYNYLLNTTGAQPTPPPNTDKKTDSAAAQNLAHSSIVLSVLMTLLTML